MLRGYSLCVLGTIHLESDDDPETADAVGAEVCRRYQNVKEEMDIAYHKYSEIPCASNFSVLHALMLGHQYNRIPQLIDELPTPINEMVAV